MNERLALIALLFLGVAAPGCEGCMRRRPAETVDLLAWPQCTSAPRDELLVARELVSGPDMLEKDVVERYSIARHGECFVGRVFLSWRLGETALEVVWGRDLLPLAAYKRMGYPGDGSRYEERGYRMSDQGNVMVRVTPEEVERFSLRGPRPTVVVPTGRGLFSVAFLRASEADVGEAVRETAVDLRRLIERIEPANVRRDPPKEVPFASEPVGTYTFMGRDTMYVDAESFVLGDLAGLVPTDARFDDAFEGVRPEVDAAGAWEGLRVAGRGDL